MFVPRGLEFRSLQLESIQRPSQNRSHRSSESEGAVAQSQSRADTSQISSAETGPGSSSAKTALASSAAEASNSIADRMTVLAECLLMAIATIKTFRGMVQLFRDCSRKFGQRVRLLLIVSTVVPSLQLGSKNLLQKMNKFRLHNSKCDVGFGGDTSRPTTLENNRAARAAVPSRK